MWAGIAGSPALNEGAFEVAISIHDSVYNTDFQSTLVPFPKGQTSIEPETVEEHILNSLRNFSKEHLCKFLGAGVTLSLLKEVRLVYLSHTLERALMTDCCLRSCCCCCVSHPFRHQICAHVCGSRWISCRL